MKIKMKSTLVALALAGAFSSAQAATINLTGGSFPYDLGLDPTDANAYSVTHTAGSSFMDIFTFQLSNVADTISSAVSLYLPGLTGPSPSYNIAGGTLALWHDVNSNGHDSADVMLASTAFGSTNGVLAVDGVAAGDYFFKLSGTATGTQGGLYQFAANTAPIPEPEAYAMKLSGPGLLGFLGRRRMKTPAGSGVAAAA